MERGSRKCFAAALPAEVVDLIFWFYIRMEGRFKTPESISALPPSCRGVVRTLDKAAPRPRRLPEPKPSGAAPGRQRVCGPLRGRYALHSRPCDICKLACQIIAHALVVTVR